MCLDAVAITPRGANTADAEDEEPAATGLVLFRRVKRGHKMNAFSSRTGRSGASAGFNGRLELPQRIFDSRKHDFPRGLAHVFRDAQHPADGVNFHAQVQAWIVDVGAVLEPNEVRSSVEILVTIADSLKARLDLFCLNFERLFAIGRAQFVA